MKKYESIKAWRCANGYCLAYLDSKGRSIREENYYLNGRYTGEYFERKFNPDGSFSIYSYDGYQSFYNADGIQIGMYDPYEDAVI